MVQTIPATKITLYDLEQRFHLTQNPADSFFQEWQGDFPPLSELEQQRLERVQVAVDNLERRSFLENTVKLAVLAPLLDLSGLFFPPFYVSTEDVVNIEATDDGLTIQGRIDILVMKEVLWLLVIESKRAEFSPKVGIPQALAYMLASPHKSSPVYGLVTNGTDFIFLKLAFQTSPCYGRSRQFVLGQDRDLERVLQILKHLAETVRET
ncbi:MAG: restriction endonuclease subunit R [Leptolyngbya foveolarum]|uniref:Restriction endonuclease subunit R n=1 Tax=Leptolyngbya foveolarum TaxID=47253 RepID=A0A2W4US82_9CYAN|nr:MAG: restriction endonuclease subunit R [Leptolyngbya foveolarum]